MRYFLAIPLPEEIKQKFHQINTSLSRFKGLRFVNPDNMHLTLLFLGDNNVGEKVSSLKKINFEPFKLKIKGLSLFPEQGKVRLLWIDLKKSKELAELQKEVSLLFNIKKEYRPHITLARIKKLEKNERNALLEAVKKTKIQEITIEVKNFKLYSSELTVLGPVHRVIEYFGATSIKEKKL